MRSGLHILGAEAPAEASADKYKPYIDAAGALVKGITEGIASANKAAPPPPAPPPPPKEDSNTVWYVAGGGAVLAILVALLVRSR